MEDKHSDSDSTSDKESKAGITLPGVQTVCSGKYHCLALDQKSKVWSFGHNQYGQLGLNDTVHRSCPERIPFMVVITQISTGSYHSLALDKNGNVWSFGSNTWGQLGLGDSIHRKSPEKISFIENEKIQFQSISAGSDHSMLLDTDGFVYTFGCNVWGQLGLGDNKNRFIATKIPNLHSITYISAFANHSMVYNHQYGYVWSFGNNQYGQLGTGDKINKLLPTNIKTSKSEMRSGSGIGGSGSFIGGITSGNKGSSGGTLLNESFIKETWNWKSIMEESRINDQSSLSDEQQQHKDLIEQISSMEESALKELMITGNAPFSNWNKFRLNLQREKKSKKSNLAAIKSHKDLIRQKIHPIQQKISQIEKEITKYEKQLENLQFYSEICAIFSKIENSIMVEFENKLKKASESGNGMENAIKILNTDDICIFLSLCNLIEFIPAAKQTKLTGENLLAWSERDFINFFNDKYSLFSFHFTLLKQNHFQSISHTQSCERCPYSILSFWNDLSKNVEPSEVQFQQLVDALKFNQILIKNDFSTTTPSSTIGASSSNSAVLDYDRIHSLLISGQLNFAQWSQSFENLQLKHQKIQTQIEKNNKIQSRVERKLVEYFNQLDVACQGINKFLKQKIQSTSEYFELQEKIQPIKLSYETFQYLSMEEQRLLNKFYTQIDCDVSKLTVEDVCIFLQLCNLPNYANLFFTSEINGEVLLVLTETDFKALGIDRLRDRKLLLYSIDMLRSKNFPYENHKQRCTYCNRDTVDDLIQLITQEDIELDVNVIKKEQLTIPAMMYLTLEDIRNTFNITTFVDGQKRLKQIQIWRINHDNILRNFV